MELERNGIEPSFSRQSTGTRDAAQELGPHVVRSLFPHSDKERIAEELAFLALAKS
jgi:hypothetical protein